MSDCIFCKIVKWEIPSIKIREDEEFIAILDLFPVTKWMTLVIPKKHVSSNFCEIDEETTCKIMKAANKVAKLLQKWLKAERVGVVIEWLEISHLHIKLYPFYEKNWKVEWFKIWWWNKASDEELSQVAKEILNN